jgi:hypothetical protein
MAARPLRSRVSLLFVFLAIGTFVRTSQGFCGLYVEFLVDRSGSMWSPWQGKSKIVTVQEAIERVIQSLPEGVATGLRVYPAYLSQAGERDPGLRIPVEEGTEDRFPLELRRLNPQGKDALAGHLRSALQDFPEGAESKLLILLCDAADIQGSSYCSMDVFEGLRNGLEFHILTLDLQSAAERQELACLASQLSGTVTHLTESDSLLPTLLALCTSAQDRNLARGAQTLKDLQARKAMEEKTRLSLSFRNTLDPFFADSVEVLQCSLDGRTVSLPASGPLTHGASLLLFDVPAARGPHQVVTRYRIQRQGGSIDSGDSMLEVNAQEGKTVSVLCYPKGRIFRWGCQFETSVSE